MKIYIVQEKFTHNPQKYVCFGRKALKEISDNIAKTDPIIINSSEFNKENYPEGEFGYIFEDTNNVAYFKKAHKILNQTNGK